MEQESRDFIAQLPTAPPAPDPKSLGDTASYIRRVMAENPEFYTDAHRAAAELSIRAAYLRSSIPEPAPETPRTVAERQHEASFTMDILPNVAEEMDRRVGDLLDLGPEAVKAQATLLREQMGGAVYDALIADAKAAFEDGKLPEGVAADWYSLRMLAAHGRYMTAYSNTKPKF